MNNATVTMPYNDFQKIKTEADQLKSMVAEKQQEERKDIKYKNKIEECIEKAAYTDKAEHKQFYLAKALETIAEHYEFDLATASGYGIPKPGIDPDVELG